MNAVWSRDSDRFASVSMDCRSFREVSHEARSGLGVARQSASLSPFPHTAVAVQFGNPSHTTRQQAAEPRARVVELLRRAGRDEVPSHESVEERLELGRRLEALARVFDVAVQIRLRRGQLAGRPQAEGITVCVDQVRKSLELRLLLPVVLVLDPGGIRPLAESLDLDEADQGGSCVCPKGGHGLGQVHRFEGGRGAGTIRPWTAGNETFP